MSSKEIKSRISHKHDIEENWEKAINFIPMEGELIIYDVDENYSTPRFKVGDGATNVNLLPFISAQASNIYISDTEPEDAPDGSVWFDTSVEGATQAEGV